MKWEPVAAMIILLGLGVWLAIGPRVPQTPRTGAVTTPFVLGSVKGEIERVTEADGHSTFRMLYRDGTVQGPMGEGPVRQLFGDAVFAKITADSGSPLFRAMNVTSWIGVIWVTVGFVGQFAFAGRWIVQWAHSERKKQSIVPATFWWWSLAGSTILFAYFVWRQDVIGVLGQTTGVVIYARNIRLLNKQARREARAREAGATVTPEAAVEPAPVEGTPANSR